MENPDSANLENLPALDRVKSFYRSATIDGPQDAKDQARNSILEYQKMQNIDVLVDSDEAFEEVKKFLRAIPPIAELAAQFLEGDAQEKEAFAKTMVELANKETLNDLANNVAANLVRIHAAKKGLKQQDENLLDDLEELDGEVQGQQAVNLVRQFYKDADVAEDAKDLKNQALDVLKRDVVNSALTFEEKQKLLEAILEVVERAVEMLDKAKELEKLLENAANSLEPIHAAKKNLKNQGDDWLKDLVGVDNEAQEAVELVKKFYKDAPLVDKSPQMQATTMLQDEVIKNQDLTPEKKKKILQELVGVAELANSVLSEAKKSEEISDLGDAAVQRLIPIHDLKKELALIKADNSDLLKNLQGDGLAVEMVSQFYQNLNVDEDAQEESDAQEEYQRSLADFFEQKLLNSDFETQKKFFVDVSVIALEAQEILRNALQQSMEYVKAGNLGLKKATNAMNKVRDKLKILNDVHEVCWPERADLLQKNFQDEDDPALKGLFYELNKEVDGSLKFTAEKIKSAIPLPDEEKATQENKHNLAIEFLEALKTKAAKIEKNLQQEIEDREALKTQERDALESVDKLYDAMESLQNSYGIDATQRSSLFPENSKYQQHDDMFNLLNTSVGGSGDGSAKTQATESSMNFGLQKISPSTTESLSEFYTLVKSRADEINAALERKFLMEQERASRVGGPMSKVDFIYPSFTPIIQSSLTEKDKIFYPPMEGVTYNRCRPVLTGVNQVQQQMIDDKFDFVTTKSPRDLSKADDVKSEINSLMERANQTLYVERHDGRLTQQEMAIAILLAIKHGGIMSGTTDSGAVINDLKKVNNLAEDENGQTDAVKLYLRMALFAENFQKLAAKEGFLTGNSYESKYAAKHNEEVKTGLRLKRLPPNYSRDLFVQGVGEIDKWEGICGDIGLTVDVLSRPVGSVSEVVSVSRPMSAISQSSGRGGISV